MFLNGEAVSSRENPQLHAENLNLTRLIDAVLLLSYCTTISSSATASASISIPLLKKLVHNLLWHQFNDTIDFLSPARLLIFILKILQLQIGPNSKDQIVGIVPT